MRRLSPNFRRAAHQALDLLLDAWAEEQRAEPAKPKRRGPVVVDLPPAPPLSPELQAQLDRQMRRNGYKKTA